MPRITDFSGCWTAVITPFKVRMESLRINWEGLEDNLIFQVTQGVVGVVPVGTTGESPTLTSHQHNLVIARTWGLVKKEDIFVLGGCGSNSTQEAFHYTETTDSIGCGGALLVDCYYNGPSSLELRENYYGKIAESFPELSIVPYIIPGRTGCALSPEDLAILARDCPNIRAVKEATGDFERMKRIRALVPEGFYILSGDDDQTFKMMTDKEINAEGVISVISNIAPAAVSEMCKKVLTGEIEKAEIIKEALEPLFGVVTVIVPRKEEIGGEEVLIQDRFRNPLPIKTMMQGLGMPAGPCRPPLGKMTFQGVKIVRDALIKVWENNPWVLQPIEKFYRVNIQERLENSEIWQKLAY